MQICQTTCFCYCISKTKNEFGPNPKENIILIGSGQYTKILTSQYTKILTSQYTKILTSQYTKILTCQYTKILTGCTNKDK